MTPYFENKLGRIYCGESLSILREMESGSVDAVMTDPPYSSGGWSKSDKNKATGKKYQNTSTQRKYPDFIGDSRDARSWTFWCSMWISECFRVLKDGGVFVMFSDWRMLPSATDAIQAGGILWRGIAVWDKTEASRPSIMGYPRHQCEYILWGTKGDARLGDSVLSGCFRYIVNPKEKLHLTGKPLELMTSLMPMCPMGGVVLDPFMGSGTTCVAAAMCARQYIGIEYMEEYCAVAKRRLEELIPFEETWVCV